MSREPILYMSRWEKIPSSCRITLLHGLVIRGHTRRGTTPSNNCKAPDEKRQFRDNFPYSLKTYVVTHHSNRLTDGSNEGSHHMFSFGE